MIAFWYNSGLKSPFVEEFFLNNLAKQAIFQYPYKATPFCLPEKQWRKDRKCFLWCLILELAFYIKYKVKAR